MPAPARRGPPQPLHGIDCQCCAPGVATQSLDEVAFDKSACAAASRGDYFAVHGIISRQPAQLHSDGHGGTSGYTPLHYAAREGHADIVELLLKAGAHPNAATRAGGATPLHRAAYTGCLRVVRLLLAGGANPSARDSDGQTPLHKAEARGHGEVAAVLREAAPQLDSVLDSRGRAPADLRPGTAAAAAAQGVP